MDDVSAGITHLMTDGGKEARAIREMLKSNKSHSNGLVSAKPAGFDIPNKVAGMAVNQAKRQSEAAAIDYEKAQVTIDVSRPEWDNATRVVQTAVRRHPQEGHGESTDC